MFGLFSKEVKIFSPVNGEAVNIEEVPDEVFSRKMMGDGIAVLPADGIFVSPADGEITMIFRTGHAFGMKTGRHTEILVHIGIDTVELEGKGFEILAEQGQKVKKGTPIVKVDTEFIRQKGYNLITPVIITSPDHSKSVDKAEGVVKRGESVIMTVIP